MTLKQTTSLWWQARSARGKRFLTGIALLLTSLLASLSIFATAPSAQPEPNPEKAWPVSTLEADPLALSPVFSTYGRVEPRNIAQLRSDVIAPITRVHVRPGEWVQQGDILVELDQVELALKVSEKEADLSQQEAQLASVTTEYRLMQESTQHHKSVHRISEKKLKRHQDLFEKHMIARSILDQVVQQANQNTIQYQTHQRLLADFPNRISSQQAQLKRARAQLQQARLNLAKTRIKAPFSGPVLEVNAAPGNYSSMSLALVKLANVEGLEIRAPISDAYVDAFRHSMAENRSIHARVEMNGKLMALEFSRLSNNIKQGQSGLDAYFRVQVAPDAALPEVGRVLKITITLPPQPDLIALPVQSLYENDRIYEVLDSRLSAITIERVGDYETETGEYRILVRSSLLKAGQEIITTQLPRAISGLLVETVNPTGPVL